MTTVKEAYDNMKNAGEAMRKAAEETRIQLEQMGKPFMSTLVNVLNNSSYVKVPYDKPKAISINDIREKMGMGDIRYNQPKEAPKASEEQIEETIITTEIYRQARLAIIRDQILTPEARTAILMAQGKQVAYGIDKYPEPLNANTWDIEETVEHILDESIDKLHYLVMLRIKLEQAIVGGSYNDTIEVRNANSRIATIARMIESNIEEMGYLVKMNELLEKETQAVGPKDFMDAARYAIGRDLDKYTLRAFTDDELKALAEERIDE